MTKHTLGSRKVKTTCCCREKKIQNGYFQKLDFSYKSTNMNVMQAEKEETSGFIFYSKTVEK